MNLRNCLKPFSFALALGLFVGSAALAQTPSRKDEDRASETKFTGPSLHLFGGVRMQKSPNADTFDSVVLGFKAAVFSVHFGRSLYVSAIAPGIGYVNRQQRLAFLISPVIFSHTSGVGLSFDLYDVRPERTGGPFGVSLNLDPIQLASFVSGLMNK
jgi:hypothetical protein